MKNKMFKLTLIEDERALSCDDESTINARIKICSNYDN